MKRLIAIALMLMVPVAGKAVPPPHPPTNTGGVSSIPVGKSVYVDSVNGSDATGAIHRADKPFLTCLAAQVAASSGDTVIVGPGTYAETGLGKNGVNWYLSPGVIVHPTVANANSYIFSDKPSGTSSAMTYSIDGYGALINEDASADDDGFDLACVYVSNAGSNITFRIESAQMIVPDGASGSLNLVRTGAGTLTGYIGSADGGIDSIWCSGGTQTVNIGSLNSTLSGSDLCLCTGGTQTVIVNGATGVGRLGICSGGTQSIEVGISLTMDVVAAVQGTGAQTVFVKTSAKSTAGTAATTVANSACSQTLSGHFEVATTNANGVLIAGSSGSPVVVLRGARILANGSGKSIKATAGTPTVTSFNSSGNNSVDTAVLVAGSFTGNGSPIFSGLTASQFIETDANKMLVSKSASQFNTDLGLGSLATVTPGTGVATALAVNVGSAGAPVLFNGAGGTPSSLTLTNATGLPAASLLAGSLGTGAFTMTLAPAANTASTGLLLADTTTASSGNQQYSPTLRWTGKGWKTTATAASQSVDFRAYVVPIQGTSAPTGQWTLESSVNGGSFGTALTYDTAGLLTVTSLTVSGGNTTLSNSNITLPNAISTAGGSKLQFDSDGAARVLSSGNNLATLGFATLVLNKTSNYSVSVNDSMNTLTNAAAAGEVDFTLPASPTVGLVYTFYVSAAQTLKVIANTGQTIRLAGSVSASAGNVTNATIGGAITIVAVTTTSWITREHEGTWTVN